MRRFVGWVHGPRVVYHASLVAAALFLAWFYVEAYAIYMGRAVLGLDVVVAWMAAASLYVLALNMRERGRTATPSLEAVDIAVLLLVVSSGGLAYATEYEWVAVAFVVPFTLVLPIALCANKLRGGARPGWP